MHENLVDKLVEKCAENVAEAKIAEINLTKCNSIECNSVETYINAVLAHCTLCCFQ